jgi:hypothetical protein
MSEVNGVAWAKQGDHCRSRRPKMAKVQRERRKYKRFQVPIGTFVGFGPHFEKAGQILDLSLGGLSFRYMGIDEPNGSSYLDIFLIDNDFYIRKLPFVTVTDFATVTDKAPISTTLRRRGVKFQTLTRQQRSDLEHFINKHAVGEA